MQALSNKQEDSNSVASTYLSKLQEIRDNSGKAETTGILDSEILSFLASDSSLKEAINQALDYHLSLSQLVGNDILMKSEASLVEYLQQGFVNFYAPATINPYVAIGAQGP